MTAAANPFDFSNPVRDREFLAGRESELEEVAYYIDQAKAGSAYSLALIGDRASGKTSLLNAIARLASDAGLLAAQIRLDEVMCGNELLFLREVFEGLIVEGAHQGMFGGIGGAEHDAFLRQVDLLDVNVPSGTEPLSFGRVFATAMRDGITIPLSRRSLLEDFAVIQEQASDSGLQGVVVLLDEADLLAANEGLLQTLRNLLMDSPRLVFVMAGTEHMFPALQDVFSPVPRQFVRINVRNFRSWRDTRRAIVKRLTVSGYDWARPNIGVSREIHSITSGNPYEVILLGHFAFREITRRQERVPIRLTAEVLEGVARQLEQQNPSLSATIERVKHLDAEAAQRLGYALDLDGVRLRDFALASLAFERDPTAEAVETEEDSARAMLLGAATAGLVTLDQDTIRVSADEYQQSYLRFFLGSRRFGDRGDLRDPRLRLAEASVERISDTAAELFGANGDLAFLTRVLPAAIEPDLADSPLIWDPAVNPDEYQFRLDVSFRTERGDWRGSIWMPVSLASDETETIALAAVERDRPLLERYGIEVYAATLGSVDLARIRENRADLETIDDPDVERFQDVAGAFVARSPGYEKDVNEWCQDLQDGTVTPPEDSAAAWRWFNDSAFMALGVSNGDAYLWLSDQALAMRPSEPLTLATRALISAARRDYAVAQAELVEAKRGHREEDWTEVFMFSPALLVRGEQLPRYEDMLRQARLDDVIDYYQAAIDAVEQGGPIAPELAHISSDLRWRKVAAADIADLEGDRELASQLREEAADMGLDDEEP